MNKTFQSFLVKLRDQGKFGCINIQRPCDVAFNNELLQGTSETVQKMQIIFAAHGCVKALSKEGPCTMCGFINESNFGKLVSAEDLIAQFDKAIKIKGFKQSSIMALLNSGSLFCEAEFPREAREAIFNKINSYKHVKQVLI